MSIHPVRSWRAWVWSKMTPDEQSNAIHLNHKRFARYRNAWLNQQLDLGGAPGGRFPK